MTGPQPAPDDPRTPWQRYLDREHDIRDHYLTVTRQAYHDFLDGPWPDHDTYERVERAAWMAYYAAGRDAWQQLVRDQAAPVIPAVPPASPYLAALHADLEAAHGLNCPECGIPWRIPSPGCPRRLSNVHPLAPSPHGRPAGGERARENGLPDPHLGSNPYPISDESYLSVRYPPDQPSFSPETRGNS